MHAINLQIPFFHPPTLMRDILVARLKHKYTRKEILKIIVQRSQADLLQSYHKEGGVKDM